MVSSRRIGLLSATAALLAGAALVIPLLGRDEPPVSRALPAVIPASAGPLLTAGEFSAEIDGATVRVGSTPVAVRYTFDQGVDHPITDAGGGHELRPLGQNGGGLTLVPQGAGLALEFPRRCALPRERDCPRAILEGDRDDELNPGTRSLRYGASILMTHADLADGANVVQKGFSVGGVSQFKLQVDHEQGHPSCVLADRERIYRAEPRLDIADGAWHDVVCTREGGTLTIGVDGAESASVPVPAGLSIANAEPLRVGGKGPGNGNDQYAGQIDNVFVTIS